MSKDLQGRPDGFKLPLHLLVENPVNLNAICASDIRGSDKVSYRINDMAIPPRASLNQLMEALVARMCAVNCTLSTVDADKLAHCLVFVSQDADKYMVLAGQALFPSMLAKFEWKTGSIIAHARHIYAKGASLDGALGLGAQRSATEIPQLVEFAGSTHMSTRFYCPFRQNLADFCADLANPSIEFLY
ncbi:hypothetical protein DYB30_005219 [Aphanomyces astaci]|uniref:Uncharacterized protein n=1 Tax=Aphanomyces astaci TaxID=112090 RepID=A0A397AZC9_APHAT|nr:hypothetical protein DYB36_006234 [Aphanomyces astaci]RHY43232.1 hypothetical protein DYB34_006516 [Aphanomyces astaci]RHY76178.1 hypothetical protein DYB30_005219 [Aphanomyces astaci]RHZ30874.1 hypothetical protein DYB31_011182 [Aphanomyces astaci]